MGAVSIALFFFVQSPFLGAAYAITKTTRSIRGIALAAFLQIPSSSFTCLAPGLISLMRRQVLCPGIREELRSFLTPFVDRIDYYSSLCPMEAITDVASLPILQKSADNWLPS